MEQWLVEELSALIEAEAFDKAIESFECFFGPILLLHLSDPSLDLGCCLRHSAKSNGIAMFDREDFIESDDFAHDELL